MMGFVRRVDFKYHCLCVDKRYCDTAEQVMDKLERQMHEFVMTIKPHMAEFSQVKVYYGLWTGVRYASSSQGL